MHLNATVKSDPNISEEMSEIFPDFLFRNLADEDGDNTTGVWGDWPPDEETKEFLFRDADTREVKEARDEDSLDDECYHDVLFYHAFLQKGSINPNWILIDTGSSINVFSNPRLLTNIHKLDQIMKINCNVGVVNVTDMGTLPGYGLVWFNGEGIANILSMANVTKTFPVSYGSKDGYIFIVQTEDGQLFFNKIPPGLYFHYFGDRDIFMMNTTIGNLVLGDILEAS